MPKDMCDYRVCADNGSTIYHAGWMISAGMSARRRSIVARESPGAMKQANHHELQ